VEITNVKVTGLNLPKERRLGLLGWGSCLVEVETNEGVTGIGESCAGGRMGEANVAVKAYIEKGYKPLLLGEDPTNYRYLWEKMHSSSWYAGTGIGMSALSGVDIALVDLAGKAWGVPACKILGGRYRNRVRPYASHPWLTPETHEEACREAVQAIDNGFTAIKVSFASFAHFGNNLREDMKYVKEIRDAIGYDVELMISDDQPPRSVSKAIMIARKLEEYDLTFWEDPLRLGDIEGYAKLTDAVDLPIEAGEEMTNQEISNFILRRAVDVVNPDVTQIGGLSEAKRIADLAYAVGIRDCPHSFWSAISAAANVHLVASMPDESMMEYRTSLPDASMEELLVEPLKLERGYIEVPKRPGLGIELNRRVVEELAFKI